MHAKWMYADPQIERTGARKSGVRVPKSDVRAHANQTYARTQIRRMRACKQTYACTLFGRVSNLEKKTVTI